jgi:hypothetical protein
MKNILTPPFTNIPDKKISPMVADPLLAQKYAEGNIQDPSRYFSSKASIKVVVGTKRGYGVDFTNIQKAIDTVNLAGGGTIFFRAGTYTLRYDITLYSNIRLLGEDYATTIIDFDRGNFGFQATGESGDPLLNIIVDNLQFTNQKPNGSSVGDYPVFDYDYVEDSYFLRCYFHDNVDFTNQTAVNLDLKNSKRIHIENNIFGASGEDADTHILAYSTSSFIYVRNNFFTGDTTTNNIKIDSQFSIMHGNTGDSPDANFIELGSASGFCVVSDNIDKGASIGSILVGSGKNVIKGNIVYASSASALTGIDISAGDHNIVSGNYVEGFSSTAGKGIYLHGGADYNIIGNNVIKSCDTGILVDAVAEDKNLIHGNMLVSNATQITDNGTGTVQADNVTV